MLRLYYYPDNASLAPHLLLVETQAEYSLELVDRKSNAQKSKEYLKLNPAGRIPTLVHGDLVLFESPAICIYICELDPQSRFIPPVGHPRRPWFFQWLAYLNNTLQAEFMVWRYPENHTADAAGIDGIRAAQDLRLGGILALLDHELGRNRFLLGDEVSACDHFLFMLALWCERVSRPPTSFGNLMRLMQEMSRRAASGGPAGLRDRGNRPRPLRPVTGPDGRVPAEPVPSRRRTETAPGGRRCEHRPVILPLSRPAVRAISGAWPICSRPVPIRTALCRATPPPAKAPCRRRRRCARRGPTATSPG